MGEQGGGSSSGPASGGPGGNGPGHPAEPPAPTPASKAEIESVENELLGRVVDTPGAGGISPLAPKPGRLGDPEAAELGCVLGDVAAIRGRSRPPVGGGRSPVAIPGRRSPPVVGRPRVSEARRVRAAQSPSITASRV
jgi:hypothetical protein